MTRPDEPCVFCAEKHLATAFELAQESGYEWTNHFRIIGSLVLAQWHLWNTGHRDLAGMIRDIRHSFQSTLSAPAALWQTACTRMMEITAEERKQSSEK